jgi:glucose/arabinose dehydrogenase
VKLLKLGDFESPTYLAAPRGDRSRRFVTERGGKVIVLHGKARSTFLDISSRVQTGGESGLLSMAFAPDYARSGRFYVYYVDNDGAMTVDGFTRSAANADRADPASRRNVIRQPHPRFNHKGGQLQFGRDGKLYFGFGDGGGGDDPDDNAQNRGVLLGKLLRIVPKAGGGYSVPRDNPFVGRGGMRGEVFAWGLRNPYRFSFDRRTSDLSIGDVGQDNVEEIDFLKASKRAKRPKGGVNFGWDRFEGRGRNPNGSSPSAPGHRRPVLQKTHDGGYCSITGGYVIRDKGLGSNYGAYVYGDLCQPDLRIARLRSSGARGDRRLGPRVSQLVSFGEDARGRVYAVSLDGPVYRLARR